MKTRNFPEKQNQRRLGVIVRLEEQLNTGVKNTNDGEIPLTETDRNRIKREIKALNSKLIPDARSRRTKKHR